MMKLVGTTAVVVLALSIVAGSAQSRNQTASPSPAAAVPDVVGFRPGIAPQEGYDLLKKRAAGVQIGIGQFPIAGVSEKPVPLSMAVNIPTPDGAEYITLWLTIPPSKQIVWAVGRTLVFDADKQVLKRSVVEGLRQKYGPATDEQYHFWAFDKQGRLAADAGIKSVNCAGRQNWNLFPGPPEGATYSYVTPLLLPLSARTVCDSLVEIRATFDNGSSSEYVSKVTVIVSDLDVARSSQEAYRGFLTNADSAKKQEEREKATDRKAPVF
jgi:hypothetical protein